MNMMDGRILVYTALLIVCSAIATFLGLAAGAWTLFQVAVIIELVHWLGNHPVNADRRRWLDTK